MSDAADDAQDFETNRRAAALADAAVSEPGPGPIFIDGVAHCAECEAVIPEARLKALPGVGLCVACAEERESER
ncbi:MAG: TraR/DksA C4-type zinc finger protein [Humidesulfovibrio sp.]|jgi:phage/conjugal plasmid C-4 type zinc finger TraR family protein|uniref:TraR/DksA C4-type zinc finger protein n=1 Tax=Humidesulfovibrio sp. TaxID=2910988 RepID=UPI0027344517|nr:TraR/DksA C4-type zinc finger protein [Humidesulfovibrio sp.]MDP2848964.1 TraR/DksA C4-type zinc finger protein [Humidesulfovibrio sp.]